MIASARKKNRSIPAAPSTEDIVARITAAIMQHRLAPGTRLIEENLGDFFGVSRTKIREALFQLARTKLVTLAPNRGALVTQPTVREARAVFEARRVIERAIVQRYIERASDEQIARLRQHLKRERAALRADDARERTRLLGDFHLLIAEGAGNEVLRDTLAELVSRTSLITLFYQSDQAASCSSDEHGELVAAIEKRDANTAADIMSAHIQHVENGLALKEEVSRTADLAMALAAVHD